MSNEAMREALRRIKYEACSLADAQVIALEALAQAEHEQEKAEAQTLREAAVSASYAMKKARIWNGMGWTYNPLHPFRYVKAMEELDAALRQQGGNV